jgi:phosphoadenosine phosphosulfate reductase
MQGFPARRCCARWSSTSFCGRLAVVSSFGTESAALLALVAEIDRGVPVLFLDTGRLFAETLRYRRRLVAALGLTDVRTFRPQPQELAASDAEGVLWLTNPDRCCAVRKVLPLAQALHGFAAWVSGRKRYQGAVRATLPIFEADDAGRIKINPLADWSHARIEEVFVARNLPRHPLVDDGYLSIGCAPCSDRAHSGEDPRTGRWRSGQERMWDPSESAAALRTLNRRRCRGIAGASSELDAELADQNLLGAE